MFGIKEKYRKLSDEELIKEILTISNERAFREIYFRYSHLVLGVCIKYIQSKSDADDIAICVFSTLKQKIEKTEIINFRSWLYTITKNECLMFLRKNKVKPSQTDIENVKDILDEKDNEHLDTKLKQLEDCIPLLKREHYTCIVSFYFNKKSYEQIANENNYSIQEVKSHIQNGKRKLLILISERLDKNELL